MPISTDPKPFFRFLCLSSFGFSALFVLLAKFYTLSATNISFMYTLLPDALNFLINVTEWIVYVVAYSLILYVMFLDGPAAGRRYWLTYGASVFFKYLLNFAVAWLTNLSMTADLVLQQLLYIAIYILIELAQLAAVVLIATITMKAYHAFVRQQTRIAKTLPGYQLDIRSYTFPFQKLFSRENILQKDALYTGLIFLFFRIISRVIYDVSYGAPTDVMEILVMLLHYLTDVLAGLAVTLVMTLLFLWYDGGFPKLKKAR